jgi:hypothetical protein
MLAKLAAGGDSIYDLIVPADEQLPVLIPGPMAALP